MTVGNGKQKQRKTPLPLLYWGKGKKKAPPTTNKNLKRKMRAEVGKRE